MSSNPELACPTVSLFQSDLVRRMTCLTPGEVAIDAGCAHDIIRIGNTTIGHKDRQRLLVDLVQVMIPVRTTAPFGYVALITIITGERPNILEAIQ